MKFIGELPAKNEENEEEMFLLFVIGTCFVLYGCVCIVYLDRLHLGLMMMMSYSYCLIYSLLTLSIKQIQHGIEKKGEIERQTVRRKKRIIIFYHISTKRTRERIILEESQVFSRVISVEISNIC
jgi:hypothetical protein